MIFLLFWPIPHHICQIGPAGGPLPVFSGFDVIDQFPRCAFPERLLDEKKTTEKSCTVVCVWRIDRSEWLLNSPSAHAAALRIINQSHAVSFLATLTLTNPSYPTTMALFFTQFQSKLFPCVCVQSNDFNLIFVCFSLSSCTVSRIRSNQQPSLRLPYCYVARAIASSGIYYTDRMTDRNCFDMDVSFFCFASLRPIHLPIITRFEFGTLCGGCNTVCCSMKWGRHRRSSSVKHPLVILNYWPSFLTVVVHVSSLQEDLQWLSKMLVPSNPSLNNCKVRAS